MTNETGDNLLLQIRKTCEWGYLGEYRGSVQLQKVASAEADSRIKSRAEFNVDPEQQQILYGE